MISALPVTDGSVSDIPVTAPVVVPETTVLTFSFEEILAAAVPDDDAGPDSTHESSDVVAMPLPVFPWRAPLDPHSAVAEVSHASSHSHSEAGSVIWRQQDALLLVPDRAGAADRNAADPSAASPACAVEQDQTPAVRNGAPPEPEASLIVAGATADQAGTDLRHARPLSRASERDAVVVLPLASPNPRQPVASLTFQDEPAAEPEDQVPGDPLHTAYSRATPVPQHGGPTESDVSRIVESTPPAVTARKNASVVYHLHEFRSEPATQPTVREASSTSSGSVPMPERSAQAQDGAPAAIAARSHGVPERQSFAASHRGTLGETAQPQSAPPTRRNLKVPEDNATSQKPAPEILKDEVAVGSSFELTAASTPETDNHRTDSARLRHRGSADTRAAAPRSQASEFALVVSKLPVANAIGIDAPITPIQHPPEGPSAPRIPEDAIRAASRPQQDRTPPLETAITGSIRPAAAMPSETPGTESERPYLFGNQAVVHGRPELDEHAEPERPPTQPPVHRDAHAPGPPQSLVSAPETKPEARTSSTAPAAPPSSDVPPPPSRPVEKISVSVGGGEGQPRAEILLHHKADGVIQMAVRTADMHLAESLRAALPELHSDLESRGFRSELHADPARENGGDAQEQQHRRPRWFYERNDDD